jgi:DNA-binding transcriptional MerR regulator/SAM-dependent methyltransferase
MRIGEFAQKHNITQDTIRHYLDMGLLVTKKDGSHYRFSEADSKEIDKIIELKQLEFSLTQIQEILCFHRLAGTKTDEYRNYFLHTLETKKEEVIKEQHRYEEIKSHINKKIDELNTDEVNNNNKLGFPMSSMEIIQCPNCEGTLSIYDGIIEKNMIINANLRCRCDYNAIIENGIYIDEKSIRKKMLNGKDMPSKKEFLDAASPKFVNFFYDGMAMLIDNIREHGDGAKYIMELENCVGTFLMQYMRYLPSNSTYILIDNDKDRLAKLKNNIELHHKHSNFMFFCCDIDKLPIVNSSIDVIIDHWMTKNYAQSKNQFLLDIVSPLLKQNGLLVGAYPHFGIGSKNFHGIQPEGRDYLKKAKVLEKLNDLSFLRIDVTDIGPIIENNPYNIDIRDKELYLTIYSGQKGMG